MRSFIAVLIQPPIDYSFCFLDRVEQCESSGVDIGVTDLKYGPVSTLLKKIKKAACMDRIASGCRDSLDRNEQKLCGGAKRDRTADLLNAIQALSQLSYSPTLQLPQRAWLERGVWIPCQGRMCQVFSGLTKVRAPISLLPSARDFVKLRRFRGLMLFSMLEHSSG